MIGEKAITTNKKAFRDYFLDAKYEAGIALKGTEVKSLRLEGGDLTDSYARIEDGEIYLYNFHIAPYRFGNVHNHESKRKRKLLLHKGEIKRLYSKTEERGYSLIPTRAYFKNGKAKIEIALGRGKKMYDKREDIKTRDANLTIRRAIKGGI